MIYPGVFIEAYKSIIFSIGQVIGEGECDSLHIIIRYLFYIYVYRL